MKKKKEYCITLWGRDLDGESSLVDLVDMITPDLWSLLLWLQNQDLGELAAAQDFVQIEAVSIGETLGAELLGFRVVYVVPRIWRTATAPEAWYVPSHPDWKKLFGRL